MEKSYTDEVQNCKDIKDSFGPEKHAQLENECSIEKASFIQSLIAGGYVALEKDLEGNDRA